MKYLYQYSILLFTILLACSCKEKYPTGTFGNDLELLKNTDGIKVLSSGDAQVAIIGKMQGRVLTSTSKGLQGRSYGYFNRKLFVNNDYINNYAAVAGEGRLFFGPEIGNYSLFFYPGDKQNHDNIQRHNFDVTKFHLLSETNTSLTYAANMNLINYQGFNFNLDVERNISILDSDIVSKEIDCKMEPNVSQVAFSINTKITNTGSENWKKETGLLSIWDLSTITPTKQSVVFIPTRNNIDSVTPYFTPTDSTRVKVIDDVVYYKSDANYMNKIGIPAINTKPIFGSYNPEMNLLTIVKFTFTDDSLYVNSNWENQEYPYRGDVINVFNDGKAPNGGGPFGPFYELESSSSAKELKVGESQTHTHTIFHFEGEMKDLNIIAKEVLGVDLYNTVKVFEE